MARQPHLPGRGPITQPGHAGTAAAVAFPAAFTGRLAAALAQADANPAEHASAVPDARGVSHTHTDAVTRRGTALRAVRRPGQAREAQNGHVRWQSLRIGTALAALACVVPAGCSASAPGAAPSPSRAGASSIRATGRPGSPGNPVVFSCGQEAATGTQVPQRPRPGDWAVGPQIIPGGKALATDSAGRYGSASYGRSGRAYKIPFIVTMGATVTVTIAAPARGRVVIANPYASGGITSATYRSCSRVQGFFAQSFAFTRGPGRGCVPLDVTVGGERQVRHVTLSLFAGSCAA